MSIQLLLADPRIEQGVDLRSALPEACRLGSASVVALLLDDPRVDVPSHQYTAIRTACCNKRVDVVRVLLAHPRVTLEKSNFFYSSNAEITRLILEDGRLDPAHRQNQALVNACLLDDREVAALLLADPRVNPIDQNRLALFRACEGKRTRTLKLLLSDVRVNPSAFVGPCLLYVCKHGFVRALYVLLKYGVIEDEYREGPRSLSLRTCEYYSSAYISGCRKGHVEIVDLLVSNRREFIDKVTLRRGLDRASQNNHTDLVNYLLERESVGLEQTETK